MPKYVLVYTKPSKREEVGKVITYDKDGVIGIFHKKSPLTKKLKPGQLVISKIVSHKSRRQNFYILYPIHIIENDIPKEYDRELEVWGTKAYRELKKRKIMKNLSKIEKKIRELDREIKRYKD
jgi:hypothetical protein